MTHRTGRWTAEEDAVLRAGYAKDGAAAVAAALGRPVKNVHKRASALRVRVKAPKWTPEEERRLRRAWFDDRPMAEIVSMFPGRTSAAIYQRAHVIGLPTGVPQGCESLVAAATRTGYYREQLVQILRDARVPVRRVRGPLARAASGHAYVDSFDLDEAVARWQARALEPLGKVAGRLGVDRKKIRRWVESVGWKPPPWWLTWMVDEAAVREVVAAKLGIAGGAEAVTRESVARATSMPTVEEVAVEIGISRKTLRRCLIRAGVAPPKGRIWRVDRDVAERVALEEMANPAFAKRSEASRRVRARRPVRAA